MEKQLTTYVCFFLSLHLYSIDLCVCICDDIIFFLLLTLCSFSNSSIRYAVAAKLLQSCPTLCNPIDGSPPGSPNPWDSTGKNTGVSFHFLLQCMKVKSESEVAQSCPTLSDSMDCSLPGSFVHGIFQARVLEWGAIAFSFYKVY